MNKRLGVKTVILTSGLEILADVEELVSVSPLDSTAALPGKKVYRLTKPFTIQLAFIPQQTPEGVGIMAAPQMMPLSHTAIQSFVDFPEDAVAQVLETSRMFNEMYIKRTTGLQLASSLG
jgi:hypothetical protein